MERTLYGLLESRELSLKSGDVFFAANPGGFLGPLINRAQRKKSLDGKAAYAHAGIVHSWSGGPGPTVKSFEALWRIDVYDFFELYRGKPVSVHRTDIDLLDFFDGMARVRKFQGVRYPWWRLPLHLAGLGKSHVVERPVCSELVALFLKEASWAKPWKDVFAKPYGWTPDNLYDTLRWADFSEPVFEGIC